MNRSGMVASSLSSVVSSASVGGCEDCSALNTPSPKFGAIVCTAATKYSQKAGQIAIAFVQRQPRDSSPLGEGQG